MKSKRLMGIIALAVCAVMAFAVQSFSLTGTPASDFGESKWSQYNNSSINAKFHDFGGVFGTNCFMFARLVVYTLTDGEINFNRQANGGREISGFSSYQFVSHFNDGGNYLSADGIKDKFSDVQVGDVVQMYWYSTPHTFIISYKDDYGIQVLQSNTTNSNRYDDAGNWNNYYGTKSINNTYYTWSDLANAYQKAYGSGGFSIYNFGIRPEVVKKPVITDAPNAAILIAGQYYSFQCEADTTVSQWGTSSGVVPSTSQRYAYSTVPPGLSINSSTGELSGTASHTSQGKATFSPLYYCFNINAKNSAGVTQKPVVLTVFEPPAFTKNALPDGEVDKPYTQTLNAEGTEYTMCWKIISGQLPPGLAFNCTDSKRTASISGTPTTPGTYKFTVQLSNCWAAPETTATKEYTIKITGIYPESNMWIEGNFKNGTVGEYYYSNAVSLYFRYLMYLSRWKLRGSNVSVVSGSLPPGLNLSWASSATWIDSKGTSAAIYLIGTPTTAGTYTFTIRAQNGMGGYTESTQTITISRPSRPFADSSMSIRYTFVKGKLGVPYNDYVAVWGGTSPYTVTKTLGIMPPGLSISQNGRYTYLRGLPTRYGTYTFTLRATGAHNGYVDKEFTMTIANNSAYLRAGVGEEDEDNPTKPKLATKKIPDAAAYSEYNITFEAGGTQPITWSYTGDLPEGFMFTDSGTLFGIPTEEGKYKFRVTAENSQGSVSKSFTLKVLPQKPVITNVMLPDGTIGEPYSFTLDSEGDPIKWTKSGKFPKGLKLDKATGEIYGTPTKAGTYTFKVKAKNKAGKDTAEFSININENPEGLSADLTQSVNSAALPADNSAHETGSISITGLYLLKDGQEFDNSAEVSAGMPLTFRIGEVPDEDDSESAASISGVKVFMNDEEFHAAEIAGDGKFTIPGGKVGGNFTVYVSGFADGEDFETTEVEIQAAGASESSSISTESSGGCNVGFAGMIMLMMSGIVLRKK